VDQAIVGPGLATSVLASVSRVGSGDTSIEQRQAGGGCCWCWRLSRQEAAVQIASLSTRPDRDRSRTLSSVIQMPLNPTLITKQHRGLGSCRCQLGRPTFQQGDQFIYLVPDFAATRIAFKWPVRSMPSSDCRFIHLVWSARLDLAPPVEVGGDRRIIRFLVGAKLDDDRDHLFGGSFMMSGNMSPPRRIRPGGQTHGSVTLSPCVRWNRSWATPERLPSCCHLERRGDAHERGWRAPGPGFPRRVPG
jgi:hypothetical protein